jgi:hypothetical protein
VSRNNEKATLSLQKRTFSDPIMRVHSLNSVTDSVKKKNVTRAVYVVARTYGKIKSVMKKRTPTVSDIGKGPGEGSQGSNLTELLRASPRALSMRCV